MKNYTSRELVILGDKLKPEDFSFQWKVWSEDKKSFFIFDDTKVYHADLICTNVKDQMTEIEYNEVMKLPEMDRYKDLVRNGRAPYLIAAMKAGYSKDMIRPSYSANTIEKLQAKLDKKGIVIDVKSLLDK